MHTSDYIHLTSRNSQLVKVCPSQKITPRQSCLVLYGRKEEHRLFVEGRKTQKFAWDRGRFHGGDAGAYLKKLRRTVPDGQKEKIIPD